MSYSWWLPCLDVEKGIRENAGLGLNEVGVSVSLSVLRLDGCGTLKKNKMKEIIRIQITTAKKKTLYKWVLWLSKVAEKKLPGNQCTIYLTYINIYLIWSLYVLDLKRVVLYFKIFHQVLFILTKNQEKGISINRFITTFHVLSGGCGFP